MGIPFHTMYAVDGLNGFAVADRVFFGSVAATYAGGANTATVAVTFTEPVPTPYAVLYSFPEQAFGYTTSATALGFTVNVIKISGNLTGGSVECVIVA